MCDTNVHKQSLAKLNRLRSFIEMEMKGERNLD